MMRLDGLRDNNAVRGLSSGEFDIAHLAARAGSGRPLLSRSFIMMPM